MEYTEIGERIKRRRVEMNVSAADLAASLALSKATIHRYENGDIKHIKMPVIESIARELMVDAAWLLGKTDKMCPADDGDLLSKLEDLIEQATDAACLVANGKTATKEQRRIIATSLGFAREYIKKL